MVNCFIDWQPQIEALSLGGVEVRWYALLWVTGLVGAYFIVKHLYKCQHIPQEKFEPLFIYCFVGVIAGARLGHCLFYQPAYFLGSSKGFIEMFIPIHFSPDSWDWHFSGYAGLASHGGALGILLALILYTRNMKMPFLTVMDNVCISVPFVSGCIRMGNLINSEIIGTPTTLPWGFIFHTHDALLNGELVPRHPAQLYEAIFYFIVFFIVWKLANHHNPHNPQNSQNSQNHYTIGSGWYFGFVIFIIFLFRFFIEFLKVEQVDFEKGMTLDMGQLLSIPFVLAGLILMIKSHRR